MIEFSMFVPQGDIFMRTEMEEALKKIFRDLILRLRYEKELTQEKMAAALVMSNRAYEYIENGDTSCGLLTAMLVLLSLENREMLFDEIQEKLIESYKRVGALV